MATTAVQKSLKTGAWILGGFVTTTLIAWLANYHWKASLVALGVPSIVNFVLYGASQFFDSAVPNFKAPAVIPNPPVTSAPVNPTPTS